VKEYLVYIGDSRDLSEIDDCSIDLVVTSPPYWHIKDYGTGDQIGHGQDLHSYLKDLYLVWKECIRVLQPGRRICINIGDQFARASIYGRYKVIPLHSEIISQLEILGVDFMGSVIWRKKTTMNTSGGAVVMGSYPYPPNGIVEIDYEHILVFKKPGKTKKVDKKLKEASKMTKEEWKQFHISHWNFAGARQIHHEAMFPEELPRRLIKMFTFKGDTVLDPFLGSGTTIGAAEELQRFGIGYELNGEFLKQITEKLANINLKIIDLTDQNIPDWDARYFPRIRNASPPREYQKKIDLKKVIGVDEGLSLRLENGEKIDVGGIVVIDHSKASDYLERYVVGKVVSIEDDPDTGLKSVFLKNRIFINGELVKVGASQVVEGYGRLYRRLRKIEERTGLNH
jgi:DNA modification methylase